MGMTSEMGINETASSEGLADGVKNDPDMDCDALRGMDNFLVYVLDMEV